MLQSANTDLFNSLRPKAHNSDCKKNRLFPLPKSASKTHLEPVLLIFIYNHLGTNGLSLAG